MKCVFDSVRVRVLMQQEKKQINENSLLPCYVCKQFIYIYLLFIVIIINIFFMTSMQNFFLLGHLDCGDLNLKVKEVEGHQ